MEDLSKSFRICCKTKLLKLLWITYPTFVLIPTANYVRSMFTHFVRYVLKIHPHRGPHVSYFLDTFDYTVKIPVGAI